MSFTYEQIELLGKTVLNRYCGHKYELHELVNAVWLIGRAQKAARISHCIHIMKCDAIVYMRTCEGRSIRGRPVGINKLTFYSIEARAERLSDEGGRHVGPTAASDTDGPIVNMIAGELRERLLRGLSRLEKLVLTMHLDGFNAREISEVAGYSESNISIVRGRVMKMCREKVRCYNKEVLAD